MYLAVVNLSINVKYVRLCYEVWSLNILHDYDSPNGSCSELDNVSIAQQLNKMQLLNQRPCCIS